ncbi:MAG: GtrA family protein [Candidatus Poseidoniaceae archaeon]|jgi:putative flippase GtrA|nr:GtrA family protein [Candidatus Poseidoniaceae archaeon]
MIPYGTFRRYMLTAIINVIIFYIIWEFFFWLLPESNYWPSIAWAIAWIIGSFCAHWTHRKWTFDSKRDPRWTVPASMAVYTIGLVGSTACYYIGSVPMGLDVRVVFLLNNSLWGFLNYLGQREIAFRNPSPKMGEEGRNSALD